MRTYVGQKERTDELTSNGHQHRNAIHSIECYDVACSPINDAMMQGLLIFGRKILMFAIVTTRMTAAILISLLHIIHRIATSNSGQQ